MATYFYTVCTFIFVASIWLGRKIWRDLKVRNLELALKQGNVHVDMSDLSLPVNQTLLKGELVGRIVNGADLFFFVFVCPVTGRIDRIKFWIGKTRFKETMRSNDPDRHEYLDLAFALDAFLRGKGRKPILPEVRE